ncbi:MAG: CPBP family intramembrane metalloprotease [Actinomycetota bacterium]|nr:CPBP family intramembrane metalloprotease [Actinomycetota bacterium]
MAFVVGAGTLLVAYNTVLNLRPLPRWTYVPLNLTVAAALVAVARLSGLTWRELGLDSGRLVAGLTVGLWAVVVVALVVAAAGWLAGVVPGLRRLLSDRRAADLSRARIAYETLVRIPLGTAVCEEVFFRGVLLAAVLDLDSVTSAVLVSSVLFGAWHVGPTLAALRENEVALPAAQRTLAVAGAVGATTIAGVVFCLLRLVAGSLSAAVLAHWACNGFALLAAHAHIRRVS